MIKAIKLFFASLFLMLMTTSSVPAVATTYAGLIEFQFLCTSTAQAVVPSGDSREWTSLTCWVDSNTPVFFGSATTTTATGIPVCKDATTCAAKGSGIYQTPVRRRSVGCVVASTSVNIRCQGPSLASKP